MDSLDRWAARHDSQQVDIAFVVDCTGSMGSHISQAQRHIIYIAETVSRTAFNVHLALVEYRDHLRAGREDPSNYISRFHDFTQSVTEMKGWVDQMSAGGGDDQAESVADGLYDALNLTYRPRATKICVWVGDAQPHGLNPNGDNFPEGCPDGRDPVRLCHQLAAKGVILYCVGCEPTIQPYRDFFMGISLITGGQYVPLQRATDLRNVIVNLTYEEVENENLMGYVDDHINLERRNNTELTVDQLTASLHLTLQLNNNRTRRMRYRSRELPEVTPLARRISYMHSLPEVAAAMRTRFDPGNEAPAPIHVDEPVAEAEPGVGTITSMDITDLDEVTPRQCERLVRRSLARNNEETLETTSDTQMDSS